MDLFAYLGRRILSENSPEHAMFTDEKFDRLEEPPRFIIYAFFNGRNDCLGIDLVERVQKLYQKFDQEEYFKLNLVLTKHGGHRLGDEDIIGIVQDYSLIEGHINK